jgi:hypothetical protein
VAQQRRWLGVDLGHRLLSHGGSCVLIGKACSAGARDAASRNAPGRSTAAIADSKDAASTVPATGTMLNFLARGGVLAAWITPEAGARFLLRPRGCKAGVGTAFDAQASPGSWTTHAIPSGAFHA